MRLLRFLVALATLLLLDVGSSAASEAMFTPLLALSGGDFSHAAAMSSDGSTLVGSGSGTWGSGSFRWTAGGGTVSLGPLPEDTSGTSQGGPYASATPMAVSGDGAVVVGIAETNYLPRYGEAFRWTGSGGMEGLGRFPIHCHTSRATAASADGSTIAGRCTTDGRYFDEALAVLWTSAGEIVDLGDAGDASPRSGASGISADGSTVVGQSYGTAFRWTLETGVVDLGDLHGSSFGSDAIGVSADGSTVVGWLYRGPECGWCQEAFRWTSDTGMVALGDLPGGALQSIATAASGDGSRVVGYGTGASGPEAFLWDETNGMRELDKILTSLGVDLSGWTLTAAHAISPDGRLILGSGINPSGHFEGWIARVPAVLVPWCGDGAVEPFEACDDGNTGSGDGCSATCAVEPEWHCEGSPSVCTAAMTFVLDSFEDEEDHVPGDEICAGASGACTLRAAVTEANARPGRDHVEVPAGRYLVRGDETAPFDGIHVSDDLDIVGTGAAEVLITSETGLWRSLIYNTAALTISDLSMGEYPAINGSSMLSNGGGDLRLLRAEVRGFRSEHDGPITSSWGTLTIQDSSIVSNLAESGGAMWTWNSNVVIERTKIQGNYSNDDLIHFVGDSFVLDGVTIVDNRGGEKPILDGIGRVEIRNSVIALNHSSIVTVALTEGTIENSTISGNRADYGGAVAGNGQVTVKNATIVRNDNPEAPAVSGVVVSNSIIAENDSSQPQCADVVSDGYNLFGVGCPDSILRSTDQFGREATPLAPGLAPIGDYGGPTHTHALLPGSPALDEGAPVSEGAARACLDRDQRGAVRPGDGDRDGVARCDIGAYELREACSDLLDNDGDGLRDTLDPGCRDESARSESPKCQDGRDNDADGRFDFDGGASAHGGVAQGPADPQCAGVAWRNREGASCGLGAELLVLLPMLRLARRRREI